MAATLTALSASLKRIYSDETFDYAQNFSAPFVELIEEAKEITPEGQGYFWPFLIRTPQNIGTPAEDGNLPPTKNRVQLEGNVKAGQFVGTFDISFMLEAAGTARGSWNKSEVKRNSWETLTDLTKHRNRIFAGTHGTGRLAQVQTGLITTNTFTANFPFHTLLLREEMMIEIRADDSGAGAVLGGVSDRKITNIVPGTRVVTFDGAVTSAATTGGHVYLAKSYGQSTVPNGLLNLVDDGSLAATLHGVNRLTGGPGGTALPALQAKVYANGGTARALTEDLLMTAFLEMRIKNNAMGGISLLLMNVGIFAQFAKLVRPSSTVLNTESGNKRQSVTLGFNDEYYFIADGRRVRLMVSDDVRPRTMFGLSMSYLRHVVLKKLGWREQGGGIFKQGVDSGGYRTTSQATMYSLENIATMRGDVHFRIDDLMDPLLHGAAYGGTDA
jgi:hypothetical protein